MPLAEFGWRTAASLGLGLVSLFALRMASKFLATRPGEELGFAPRQATRKERFARLAGLAARFHLALLVLLAVQAALLFAVRPEACEPAPFPGSGMLFATATGTRWLFLALLAAALLLAVAEAVNGIVYARASRREKWGDERAPHHVVVPVVLEPVALLVVFIAGAVTWAPFCR